MAQEIGSLIVNVSKAYSNRGSGKNKHSHHKPATIVGRIHAKIYVTIDALWMQYRLESRVMMTESAML